MLKFQYCSSSSQNGVTNPKRCTMFSEMFAAAMGDKARVIKIDVEKNQDLADALRIKGLPTLIIYKSGDMKWRKSGELDANTIIGRIQEYV